MKFILVILIITLAFSMIIILTLGFYPIIAWARSRVAKRPVRKSNDFIQRVSIIIAAHNEEKHIRQKLDSFLDPGEWIEGSEIIVVANGCTDATLDILSGYSDNQAVKVINLPGKASKIFSVNKAVEHAKNEILIFSDCRQDMKKGSVKQLVHNFNDPDVGTVNSILTQKVKCKRISFRNLLTRIAGWESLSGSSLNVFGALYAQRKEAFRTFPDDILFDDLFVVVSTIIQKKRLVTEANAVIYDVPFEDYYVKDRISRLARGLLLFLTRHFELIRQMPFNYFCRFLIFKYLKLILPFVLIILCIDLILLFVLLFPLKYLLVLALLLAVIMLIGPVRRLFIHFIRINLHFFDATIRFALNKERSVSWSKLKI